MTAAEMQRLEALLRVPSASAGPARAHDMERAAAPATAEIEPRRVPA